MSEVKRWLICASLLAGLLLFGTGCPSPNTGKPPDKKMDGDKGEHKPPHGGILYVGGGEEYHAELMLDKANKKATIYLLDDKPKNPVPIKAETITLTVKDTPPVQITLKADRQEGDPEGQASRFSGTHDRLGSDLNSKKVTISATINGKAYEFELD
jgi:hypothetical protein